ncbi:hypothetical protein C475_03514 [Halosimplex carlsbadense 2-9-1]|uniref:Lipoprotein n=1 Tax=Halosimplex carlsbadense 2-9-1 TaxID=797114 RepID=M0D321_9EURY|nr:hypothetical protein [Halosimplex carlsbadense]ELZ29253.1 hypothetical protein C475_03514 [Halosimplex carlsbadense 2-9-1]
MDWDRRRYLGLLAAALAGTAGCLGNGGDATVTDLGSGAGDGDLTATPTATGPPTVTDRRTTDRRTATAPRTTPAPSLVLDSVEPTGDASLTVYPPKLASILREAAAGDGPVRAVADAFVYAPVPVVPSFDAVAIDDPHGDAGGTYAVDCEGGTYHEMTLQAEEVPSEEADDPTPVSSFRAPYRELVVDALTEPAARTQVAPQTERGEWVREHFFGEYVAYEGQTYRGRAVHPTDAVFFSTEVWYVCSLSPVDDADDSVRLRLPEIDPAVRNTVDGALEEWSKNERAPAAAGPPLDESVRAFADGTDRILTHTHAYDPSVRSRDERESG